MITEDTKEIFRVLRSERKKFKNKEQGRNFKRFAQRKRHAISTGIEFTIGMSDLVYPERCPLLNIPLHYHSSNLRDNWPSIDRIDNTKGYIPGNVWIISYKANRIKSDSNPGELMLIALSLKKKLRDLAVRS